MISFKFNKKKSAGFSLMEMMIVIAIIAIMSAITLPALSSSEHRVRKVARELIGGMQKARMMAVKTNSDVAIIFDTNTANPRYLICTDNGADNTWSTIADNTIAETIEFTNHSAGVYLSVGPSNKKKGPVTYNNNILTFNPRGTCNGGFVYISDDRNTSYRVGTLATGIIRIQYWNGSSFK